MNVTIKLFTTFILAILFMLPSMATANSDKEKDEKKNYKKIELQLIKKYLAAQESSVAIPQNQVIKAYNENEELEFKGKPDCIKARKIIRQSDLLVETETSKIYLTKD